MKYKLETIPVWDALREESECPFCGLMEKAEERYVRYYLGNSAMNPETRVEVNRRGFCPEHFSRLLLARNPQHLGLIAHTHLQERREQWRKDFPRGGAKGRWFAKGSGGMAEFSEKMAAREEDCLICERIERTLKRYTFTTAYLWKNREEGFREELTGSRGFCLPHARALMRMAEEVLPAKELKEFLEALAALQERNLQRLEEEILWFTQKFKAENHDKPWGSAEDAHYRLVQKLTGRITPH